MEEKDRGIIFEWINNWKYKDFTLGFNLSSQNWNEFREFYLIFSLGFWQVFIGFRV